MPTAPIRRLGLADALILVASTAPAIAWVRAFMAQHRDSWSFDWSDPAECVLVAMVLAEPFVVSGTFVVLAMRLRRPRPAWRRLARQPGWVAVASAVFGIGLSVLMFAATAIAIVARGRLRIYWTMFIEDTTEILILATPTIGACVASAWLALRMSGRSRPERGALDRLGRAIGVAWIVLGLGSPWAWLDPALR